MKTREQRASGIAVAIIVVLGMSFSLLFYRNESDKPKEAKVSADQRPLPGKVLDLQADRLSTGIEKKTPADPLLDQLLNRAKQHAFDAPAVKKPGILKVWNEIRLRAKDADPRRFGAVVIEVCGIAKEFTYHEDMRMTAREKKA